MSWGHWPAVPHGVEIALGSEGSGSMGGAAPCIGDAASCGVVAENKGGVTCENRGGVSTGNKVGSRVCSKADDWAPGCGASSNSPATLPGSQSMVGSAVAAALTAARPPVLPTAASTTAVPPTASGAAAEYRLPCTTAPIVAAAWPGSVAAAAGYSSASRTSFDDGATACSHPLGLVGDGGGRRGSAPARPTVGVPVTTAAGATAVSAGRPCGVALGGGG